MHSIDVQVGDLSESVFESLKGGNTIAWDIETTGLDWSKDRIATCQLDGGSAGRFLVRDIDALPLNLCALLADSSLVKVFHHAPFDLRFMTARWGVKASRVRCTKVASRILNPVSDCNPHSLKALLCSYLGVEIDKGERLSDWTRPELDAAQLEYAANDVRYLVSLLRSLEKELAAAGHLDLYVSCCEFLPVRVDLELGRWPDVFSY